MYLAAGYLAVAWMGLYYFQQPHVWWDAQYALGLRRHGGRCRNSGPDIS